MTRTMARKVASAIRNEFKVNVDYQEWTNIFNLELEKEVNEMSLYNFVMGFVAREFGLNPKDEVEVESGESVTIYK